MLQHFVFLSGCSDTYGDQALRYDILQLKTM